MAMGEQQLNEPPTVHLLVHRHRVPVIEVASDLHGFGTRRSAIEVGRLEGIPGRIKLAGRFVVYRIHMCLNEKLDAWNDLAELAREKIEE